MSHKASGAIYRDEKGTYGEPGSWFVRYKYPDPVTGRRREKWRSNIRTRREAQEIVNRISGEVYTDSVPTDARVGTVADGWQVYRTEFEAAVASGTKKESTLRSWDRAWRNHVGPRWGHRPMAEIMPADIYAFFSDLATTSLGTSSLRHIWHVASSCFESAVTNGLLGASPFARVKRKALITPEPKGRGREKAWERHELQAFLAALEAEGHRNEWLWRFILLTGLRNGEAMGLRDSDVVDATLTVSRQYTYLSRTGNYFTTPKTDSSARTFGLSEAALRCVREQQRRRAEYRLALPGRWPDDTGLLWVKPDGELAMANDPYQTLRRFTARHDIRFVGIHGLRHTFATMGLDAGVETKIVSDTLGHSQSSTTSDIYMHTNTDMTRRAGEQIASALGF